MRNPQISSPRSQRQHKAREVYHIFLKHKRQFPEVCDPILVPETNLVLVEITWVPSPPSSWSESTRRNNAGEVRVGNFTSDDEKWLTDLVRGGVWALQERGLRLPQLHDAMD